MEPPSSALFLLFSCVFTLALFSCECEEQKHMEMIFSAVFFVYNKIKNILLMCLKTAEFL